MGRRTKNLPNLAVSDLAKESSRPEEVAESVVMIDSIALTEL